MNNVMGRHEPRNDWVIAAAPDRCAVYGLHSLLLKDNFQYFENQYRC